MNNDKRSEFRARTLKRGQVRIDDGGSVFDCIIRDLTESGAKLHFEDTVALPANFDLFLVEAGAVWPVRNVWQKGADVGVAFFPTDIPRHN